MTSPLPQRPKSIQQRVEQRRSRMKALRYVIFLPTILIGGITAAGAFFWPSVPSVETGQSQQYQDLQPQYLDASPAAIVQAIQNVVNDHRKRFHFDGDRPMQQETTHAQIYLVANGPLLPLVTRIEIRIHTSNSGKSVVNMDATGANSGKTDFGLKARNLRFLQDAIETELAR